MYLETDRLILRPFTFEDDAFIVELVNTEGWLRFIGDRNVKNTEDARRYLQKGPMDLYAKHGFGLNMVALKDGTPIGMCGFVKRDMLDHADIGFAMLPTYFGKGYAFEVATATLQYGLHTLGFQTVLAITSPDNVDSGKLLEKLGFKFDRLEEFPPNAEMLKVYVYNKQEQS
jgi:[ribosomal protein S5]-alanine N-acetyltransferase